MRMRKIDEGYQEHKATDPGSALTKTALRRLVTTGAIPSVKIGAKYIFDLDILEAYLSGKLPQKELEEPPEYGTIRRVGG